MRIVSIFHRVLAKIDNEIDDVYIRTVLSDMNPFLWSDESSADPVMYDEYINFLKRRTITIDNSLEIAKEYLGTIDYVDVTDALKDMPTDKWIAYCKKYLAEPHKGGEARQK